MKQISRRLFYVNLNDIDRQMLPALDIVTLFHFGEMPSTFGPASHDRLDDLLSIMNPGGRVLFYNRSAEWGNARPVVEDFVAHGSLEHIATYEELEVYRCQP